MKAKKQAGKNKTFSFRRLKENIRNQPTKIRNPYLAHLRGKATKQNRINCMFINPAPTVKGSPIMGTQDNNKAGHPYFFN
jgi:hypothetical protein